MQRREQFKDAVLTYLEEAQLKARISTDAETGMGATISGDPKKAGKRKKTVRAKDLIPFEPDEKMETPEARAKIDGIKKAIQSGKKLPPLVTRNTKKGRQVIDGHHRLKAHKELGTKKVQIARPSKISVEPNMTKIKAREQFRDAVLNYLNEFSQVGQRAQFDRKARLMRNRFGADVDPNAGSSVAAQAKAKHNQRMATKRFGAGAYAGAGNTAAAQSASDRQMKQTNKRFQGRREQFKNAVLNYLDETSLGLKTAVSTARSMKNRSIPDVQLITTKADYDPKKVKDQDKRDNQEVKNNARMEKAAVAELKPRSDEGKSTGGDVGATMDRLGKWYKGINPNAKPRQKGYMRKRNVPPAEAEYDPTKHKAPVEGEPLEYMKPQHKDYAIASINNQVGKVAARGAEKEDRDLGPAGNIHKRHKAKLARQKDLNKIGRSILDKYKVPNPISPRNGCEMDCG